MRFDDVYPTDEVIAKLSELSGCRVGVIPFMDCNPSTSYLISEDGKNVFVSIDFGGYCQIRKIPIIDAGKRSKNSKPCFRRRNGNGVQTCVSLASAVYGTFKLGEIPSFRLSHADGNVNNCHIGNLKISYSSKFYRNIHNFANLYQEGFYKIVSGIIQFKEVSLAEAEDFASFGFLSLCETRIDVQPDLAQRLWLFLSKRFLRTYYARNRLVYDIHTAVQRAQILDDAEEEHEMQRLTDRLPDNCRKAVMLLVQGYTQREISAIMNCSQANVCNLLKRSRSILKEYDNKS